MKSVAVEYPLVLEMLLRPGCCSLAWSEFRYLGGQVGLLVQCDWACALVCAVVSFRDPVLAGVCGKS